MLQKSNYRYVEKEMAAMASKVKKYIGEKYRERRRGRKSKRETDIERL